MIRSSSDHSVFSCFYKNYKSFLAVETDDILLATQNSIFKRLMQEFDTLFVYTFQGAPKLNLLNVRIFHSEYIISIEQTDNIMKTLFSNIG